MAMTDNTRGAVLMMGAMAAFTLNDALMKSLAGEVPLFQAIFLRGIATTLLIGALAWGLGAFRKGIARADRGRVAVRILGEVGAAYFFITALFNMPLANATAIIQALPLTVTLAGAVFLGEAVGWRRLSAILAGMVGVLMIVRPGLEGFTVFSLYALAAVGFVTLRDIVTRKLSSETDSLAVTFASAVGVAVFAGLAAIGQAWVPLTVGNLAVLAGASVFILGGYLFSVMVMRVGEIGFVAPFRYTALLWALILGFLVFGDWPDPLTLAGAAIIVASGIYTFYRERDLARLRAKSTTRTGM